MFHVHQMNETVMDIKGIRHFTDIWASKEILYNLNPSLEYI